MRDAWSKRTGTLNAELNSRARPGRGNVQDLRCYRPVVEVRFVVVLLLPP